MKFSIRCSFSAKMCTYYSPNMAYLNSTLIHTLLPEKHGIFFVKLIQSTHDKKKQPLPQSCSYKAWERHHDSLIGMCGCTKIRCFVRLKTPRKLCYINYQQLTKHLNTHVIFVCYTNMHKSYTLFKNKLYLKGSFK